MISVIFLTFNAFVLYSPILIKASPASTVPSAFTITSPQLCVHNEECGTHSFCNWTASNDIPRCNPLLTIGEKCFDAQDKCLRDLLCSPQNEFDAVCTKKGNLNATCSVFDTLPCRSPLACNPSTNTCTKYTFGFAGDKCFTDEHCQPDHFCKPKVQVYPNDDEDGLCQKKKPAGAGCSAHKECLGFCDSPNEGEKICFDTVPLGAPCSWDYNCRQSSTSTARVFCNKPDGPIGHCTTVSRLIKRLGAKCRRPVDLCDARRDLSCAWASSLGRMACQHGRQRVSNFVSFHNCQPGSRLSTCKLVRRSFPAVCRLPVIPGWAINPAGYRPVYACQRKLDWVPQGAICDTEHAVCKNGTVCRSVQGILVGDNVGGQFGTDMYPYCVRIRKIGERCPDKFKFQCGSGLSCERDVCVKKSKGSKKDEISHAGLDGSCEKLPCSPGLECSEKKICEKPTVVVGKMGLCSDSTRTKRKCREGLVCALKRNGWGTPRCRKPHGIGEYCEKDAWCVGWLKCSPAYREGRKRQDSRCYNPRKALKIGQRCNPFAKRFGWKCISHNLKTRFGTFSKRLVCLPNKGRYTCKMVAGVFKKCSPDKNLVCNDWRLYCSARGVCEPRRK